MRKTFEMYNEFKVYFMNIQQSICVRLILATTPF